MATNDNHPPVTALPKAQQRQLRHGDWVLLAVNPTTTSPPVQLIAPANGRAMINHWETKRLQGISLDSVVQVVHIDGSAT